MAKEWIKKEEEFMRRNYKKFPKELIAEKLGRSISSIKSKARTSVGNFCDKTYKITKFNRKCEECKKPIHRNPSKIKRNKHFFCSKKCFYNSDWYKEERVKNVIKKLKTMDKKWAFERPSSFEKKIIELINEHNLPFKYVGNGDFWIEGRNPDFVESNGEKLLIETCSSLNKDRNLKKVDIFNKYGFKTLLLTEKDLNRVNWKQLCLEKIYKFERGENI